MPFKGLINQVLNHNSFQLKLHLFRFVVDCCAFVVQHIYNKPITHQTSAVLALYGVTSRRRIKGNNYMYMLLVVVVGL